MDEFIERLSTSANIEHPTARRVTQLFLHMVNDHLSQPVSSDLFQALPGASELVREHAGIPMHAAPSTGIEAMMQSAMRNALGVEDPFITIYSDVKAAGLTSGQAMIAGQEFLKFAREKAGARIIERIVDEIPGLARLN